MKRLYRSEKNKVMFGVLGGIAEYFAVDPVLIRVLFIFMLFFTGVLPGILGYIVVALVIPHRPHTVEMKSETVHETKTEDKKEEV